MELGLKPMNAVGYRVLAKRLRSALAGQTPSMLGHGFPELPQHLLASLKEALEARHFDEFGELYGPAAREVKVQTQQLMARLRLPDAS